MFVGARAADRRRRGTGGGPLASGPGRGRLERAPVSRDGAGAVTSASALQPDAATAAEIGAGCADGCAAAPGAAHGSARSASRARGDGSSPR